MCHKCECAGAGIAAFLLGALVGAAAGGAVGSGQRRSNPPQTKTLGG